MHCVVYCPPLLSPAVRAVRARPDPAAEAAAAAAAPLHPPRQDQGRIRAGAAQHHQARRGLSLRARPPRPRRRHRSAHRLPEAGQFKLCAGSLRRGRGGECLRSGVMQYYLFMVELVLLLTKDTLTFVEIKMKVMQLGNWIIIAASTDKTSSQYRMLMVDTGQSGHTARWGV